MAFLKRVLCADAVDELDERYLSPIGHFVELTVRDQPHVECLHLGWNELLSLMV